MANRYRGCSAEPRTVVLDERTAALRGQSALHLRQSFLNRTPVLHASENVHGAHH